MSNWKFEHIAHDEDDHAIGADYVDGNGEIVASCLLTSDGEVDVDSDGCGVFGEELSLDDIDWPSYEEAASIVFGAGT